MINVIETLLDYIKNSSTDDSPPRPHIGETMGCWLYFTALAEEIPALIQQPTVNYLSLLKTQKPWLNLKLIH